MASLLSDEPTSPPPLTAERTLYFLLRFGVMLTGLLLIVGTLSSQLLMPELFYDELPEPPPLRERLPGVAVSLGMGVLLCAPHRWTRHASMFRLRLTVYGGIAAFICWRAARGITAGSGGGRSWHIVPMSIVMACIGLSLPTCLLWSRRIGRASQSS